MEPAAVCLQPPSYDIHRSSFTDDPWRESTVIAAGSPFQNTTSHPVGLSDGYHCSDLLTSEGTHDSSVFAVQQQGLAAMSRWLPTFQPTAKRASW
jgi:hypothetical protein